MARTLTVSPFSIKASGDSGLKPWTQDIASLESTSKTDVVRYQSKLTSTSDTYTIANLLGGNMGEPQFIFLQNHSASNTMTITVTHDGGGANATPDVFQLAAGGIFLVMGSTASGTATTSIAVGGTAGDAYTLILADA